MAKTLPMGQYLRNYLLRQTGGANIGQSAPATLTALLIEDAVALIGVLLLGIDGWGWLRALIVVSALAFALAIFGFYRLVVTTRMPSRIADSSRFRALLVEGRLFKASTALLAHPRGLALQSSLGAAYLVLGAGAFYSLLLGLGVTGVPLPQAIAVYLFSLACGLLIPIPVDIGLIELSGTTALLAVGVSRGVAVSAMLLNRVLGGAAAILIALATMVMLREELRAALRSREDVQESVRGVASSPVPVASVAPVPSVVRLRGRRAPSRYAVTPAWSRASRWLSRAVPPSPRRADSRCSGACERVWLMVRLVLQRVAQPCLREAFQAQLATIAAPASARSPQVATPGQFPRHAQARSLAHNFTFAQRDQRSVVP